MREIEGPDVARAGRAKKVRPPQLAACFILDAASVSFRRQRLVDRVPSNPGDAGTIRGTAVTISNTEKTRRGGGNRHHADDQRRGGERDDDHGDDGLDHSPGYSWGIAWALPQQCTRTRTK